MPKQKLYYGAEHDDVFYDDFDYVLDSMALELEDDLGTKFEREYVDVIEMKATRGGDLFCKIDQGFCEYDDCEHYISRNKQGWGVCKHSITSLEITGVQYRVYQNGDCKKIKNRERNRKWNKLNVEYGVIILKKCTTQKNMKTKGNGRLFSLISVVVVMALKD
ncbi:MAG: hypothetical protein GY679_01490 [Mycoplasma sp.]|nr:hypothetical protein [Mycoplasma sp.]